ncbi:Zinc finger CCCH-type [Trinorchestia longiramus]|nr:Zinc finger CCCH-type [Trinorchestia longiramus]
MKSQDSKSLWTTQPEKPVHYSYLKEFRVEQCPLFLQHKCTQHRPYTCFHWHFLNQRRRRPIRKRDGSFNYSPDNYCTKFDENTGICPDGDDCPFLHRTAGDTERRYHLRYYKTGMCVHDTDVRGFCVKNGAHCAFAHGVEDVRPPVYDLRELHQGLEGGLTAEGVQQLLMQDSAAPINGGSPGGPAGVIPNSLDKERNMVNDDPRWQDTAFVLANYKTEQCKRPPRLCRQGYACPQYHNSRDRRRPPKKYKYRSTACPNVKHSDEWGEPSNCESGDACQYCHTRTEQQFHPEIYKSSKCNDIQQTGYCPRGVFCAFAHVDQEMTAVRETAASENCTGTSLADILQSALPPDNPLTSSSVANSTGSSTVDNTKNNSQASSGLSESRITSNGFISPSSLSSAMPPIGSKSRHFSGSSVVNSSNILPNKDHSSGSIFSMHNPPPQNNSYLKAPGSERETETNLKKQLAAKENAAAAERNSLDALEKLKRKTSNNNVSSSSLFSGNNVSGSNSSVLSNGVLNTSFAPSLGGSSLVGGCGGGMSSIASTVSPLAPPFYPTSNTVESVVGNALDELSLSDLSAAIDPDFNSISSSLNTGLASSGLISGSTPVTIPGKTNAAVAAASNSFHDRTSLLSNLSTAVTNHQQLSSSPSSTAFHPHANFLHATNSIDQNNLTAAFLRVANGNGGAVGTTTNTAGFSQTTSQSGGVVSNHLFEAPSLNSSSASSAQPSAAPASLFNNFHSSSMGGALSSMSPHQQNSVLSQSPLLFHGGNNGGGGVASSSDIWRMREELITNRAKLASWEEGIAQARTACEAWKREVDEANRKIKVSEQAREELLGKLGAVQQELEASRAGKVLAPYVQVLNAHTDLDALPRHVLQQLSSKLRTDADAVDKALNRCSLQAEWSNVPDW